MLNPVSDVSKRDVTALHASFAHSSDGVCDLR